MSWTVAPWETAGPVRVSATRSSGRPSETVALSERSRTAGVIEAPSALAARGVTSIAPAVSTPVNSTASAMRGHRTRVPEAMAEG